MHNSNLQQQKPSNIVPMPQSHLEQVPQSPEAEEAVIGSVLINPSSFIKCRKIITGKDFFLLRHQYIWDAFERLDARDVPIELVGVVEELDKHGQLDGVGGVAYLTGLVTNTPTSVYAEVYADFVHRTSHRRTLLKAIDNMRQLALDESIDIADVDKGIINQALDNRARQKDDIAPAVDLINSVMDTVEAAMEGDRPDIYGVTTGISSLDKILDGMHKNWLYVVGGIQHHGKTSLLLTMALNAAKAGKRVLFFNTSDGDNSDIIIRLLGMETGIAPNTIKTGRMTPQEYARYVEACGRMSKWKLFIQTRPGITPLEIYNQARLIQQEHGIDLILVDYIQGMGVGGGAKVYQTEKQQIDYCIESLDKMCKKDKFDCPIVVGAQINRQGKRNKRPSITSMKGSGRLEELAGVGIIVYHCHLDDKAKEKGYMQIAVEKNKVNGEIGVVEGRLDTQTTLIRDWEETTRYVDLGDDS